MILQKGVNLLIFTERDLKQLTLRRNTFSSQTKTSDNYYCNLEDGDRTKLVVGKHIRSNFQPNPNARLEPIKQRNN